MPNARNLKEWRWHEQKSKVKSIFCTNSKMVALEKISNEAFATGSVISSDLLLSENDAIQNM